MIFQSGLLTLKNALFFALLLSAQLSFSTQLVISFDNANPTFPVNCGDSWSEEGIDLQIENDFNPNFCNFYFNSNILTLSSAQLLLDFSNLGTINQIEVDIIPSCGDLFNKQLNSNSTNKTYQGQDACINLEFYEGLNVVSTISCTSNYTTETLVFENTSNFNIDNMKVKSLGGEILQIKIFYNTIGEPGDYLVNVPTNYSDNVNVTLNNNQNILQNNNAEVIDYLTCNENNNSNCNPIIGFNDLAANEVLWATEKAYAYFLEKHNFSLSPITSYVNNSIIGNQNQAYYNKVEEAIYYGMGDGIERTSMTEPDIVGHEITHHLIDSISQLKNYKESGALQESFADIFGEMIEYYCDGSNDWIFGRQVVSPNAGYTGIRNLANPSDINMKNLQPAYYKSEKYWIVQNDACQPIDYCGIHTNNGVQNYWFYLLSEGGSGINEIGDAYNITGIGKEKAARIAFENLKNISTNTETVTPHYQAMYGAIQAAQNLFGENSNEVVQTKNAWQAVGLYENIANPIKWKVANQLDGQIIENGDTTMIPVQFDLVIDSLDQELTADKLSINLNLPNQVVIDSITAIAPLLQSELTIEIVEGETNVIINRQSNQVAKVSFAPRIKSGSSILGIAICIPTVDIGGEGTNLQIGISGGTDANTFLQFEPIELPLGSEYNHLNAKANFLLNLALGLKQKSCSALGWLDVDVLNGDPPFKYILKNSMNVIVEEIIKSDSSHQLLNLVEGDYELNIQEENGQKNISKSFTISHYANINGSECCPENLIIPAGQFNGLFIGQENISLKNGSTLTEGKIDICKY